MCDISDELLQKAEKLLREKPSNSKWSDIDCLKLNLHIGIVTANQILEKLNKLELTINFDNLTDDERDRLLNLLEKSAVIQRANEGKDLIGRQIPAGTRFKVINVEPHRQSGGNTYKCLDEYIGQIGIFPHNFTFSSTFCVSGKFDKKYMEAIDKENGKFQWRWDEIEIIDAII